MKNVTHILLGKKSNWSDDYFCTSENDDKKLSILPPRNQFLAIATGNMDKLGILHNTSIWAVCTMPIGLRQCKLNIY